MRTLRLALALVLAGAMPLSAQQEVAAATSSVTVVVYPFSVVAPGQDAQALAVTLRGMMVSELGQLPNVRLVEREAIDQLLRARQVKLATMTDQEAAELAQLLGAQYAVAGGMVFDRTTVRMDARAIDVETSEILKPPIKQRMPKDDYLDVVDAIGAQLRGIKLRARVAEVVAPVPAVLAYSRGLDYEKRGDRVKAAAMYRRALELFPDYGDAKTALSRVNQGERP